jgi:UDP-glucose 4-epimerase
MDTPPSWRTGASTPDEHSFTPFSRPETPETAKSTFSEESVSEAYPKGSVLSDFVLVVGGLGYIGSHTSWELLKAGFNVIIVDNLSNSFRSVRDRLEHLRVKYYQSQVLQPTLDFYEADYRDQRTMRAIVSKYSTQLETHQSKSPASGNSTITGVIHFAAYKAVTESFQKPLDYYANNVAGMIDFCTLLDQFCIKTLVFSSSATVYGELANKGGRLLEEYCDSSSCRGLTSPYGRTKWMCEAILNDIAVSDPEWTVIALRYFNPIGCDESGMLGEDPRDTPNNLMPIVVKVMTGELPVLNVYGSDWDTVDGTAIRDFVHVSDLARGHLAALNAKEKLGQGFKTFNLGTGTGHSVKEVVASMERVSGRAIPTNMVSRRDGDVAICMAEPSKSLISLGWRRQKTLDDCCRDICRFLNLDVQSAEAWS